MHQGSPSSSRTGTERASDPSTSVWHRCLPVTVRLFPPLMRIFIRFRNAVSYMLSSRVVPLCLFIFLFDSKYHLMCLVSVRGRRGHASHGITGGAARSSLCATTSVGVEPLTRKYLACIWLQFIVMKLFEVSSSRYLIPCQWFSVFLFKHALARLSLQHRSRTLTAQITALLLHASRVTAQLVSLLAKLNYLLPTLLLLFINGNNMRQLY